MFEFTLYNFFTQLMLLVLDNDNITLNEVNFIYLQF